MQRAGALLACLVVASGCGGGNTGPAPPPEPETPPGESPLQALADSSLREAVVGAVGKPASEVTAQDLEGLAQLAARELGITDLTGMSRLAGLETLDLSWNRIAAVDSLEGLSRLQLLDLTGNRVEDIGPLARLEVLRILGWPTIRLRMSLRC